MAQYRFARAAQRADWNLIEMTKKNYHIENLFKALADRTRLRLISLIGDSEVCVCFFVAILKTSQPKISRHLAYLRRAGIVKARREGKWMHYRLAEPPDEHAARIFREVGRRERIGKMHGMWRDTILLERRSSLVGIE